MVWEPAPGSRLSHGSFRPFYRRHGGDILACGVIRKQEERLMRKLMLTLAAAALVLGTMAVQASAQQQRGAACIAALKNATPIVKEANCRGGTGACGCGPGFISACRHRCCHCVPAESSENCPINAVGPPQLAASFFFCNAMSLIGRYCCKSTFDT
jgi:hypothetical protein